MKFSQMEYQRPDVDGMIEQYKPVSYTHLIDSF